MMKESIIDQKQFHLFFNTKSNYAEEKIPIIKIQQKNKIFITETPVKKIDILYDLFVSISNYLQFNNDIFKISYDEKIIKTIEFFNKLKYNYYLNLNINSDILFQNLKIINNENENKIYLSYLQNTEKNKYECIFNENKIDIRSKNDKIINLSHTILIPNYKCFLY